MSTMKYLPVLLILVLGSWGCRFGPSVEDFRPARSPEGIRARLDMGQTSVRGELLAVDNTGLYVLTGEGVVLAPYKEIVQGRFEPEAVSVQLRGRTFPGSRKYNRLRLMSRFPQGLDDELLDRLLTANDQTELKVVQ